MIHPSTRHRLAGLAGVAAIGLGALTGCGGSEGPETAGGGPQPADAEPSESPSEVTFNEVLSNTEPYLGKTVAVSAEVDEVIGTPGAFTLGGEVDDDELIVLPTADAEVPQADIDEDTAVRVQGRVVEVNSALTDDEDLLFEEEGDFALLDDYDGKPGIVASSVKVINDPQ